MFWSCAKLRWFECYGVDLRKYRKLDSVKSTPVLLYISTSKLDWWGYSNGYHLSLNLNLQLIQILAVFEMIVATLNFRYLISVVILCMFSKYRDAEKAFTSINTKIIAAARLTSKTFILYLWVSTRRHILHVSMGLDECSTQWILIKDLHKFVKSINEYWLLYTIHLMFEFVCAVMLPNSSSNSHGMWKVWMHSVLNQSKNMVHFGQNMAELIWA